MGCKKKESLPLPAAMNMGGISPIEKSSAVLSAGTSSVLLDHISRAVMMNPEAGLHLYQKTSPTERNESGDITFSDVQSIPGNIPEEESTRRVNGSGRVVSIEEVRTLQHALNEILAGEMTVQESGEFTEETEDAIMRYQEMKRVAQTGEVNEEQWGMILQDAKKKHQGRLQI